MLSTRCEFFTPHRRVRVLLRLFILLVCCRHDTAAAASANDSTLVLFIYATPIADAGWTSNLNTARLNAFNYLTSAYPQAGLDFDYVESFLQFSNRSAALEEFAAQYDMIYSGALSNYAGLNISDFARRYPDVLWVQLDTNGVLVGSVTPPNLVFHAVDYWEIYFAAGAIAGAELDSGAEACMVYPLPSHNMVVNAFYQGMQFAGSSGSFSAVRLLTFYDSLIGEHVAAELVRRGCAIVARFTDTNQVEQYVASLNNDTFSIGYGGDSGIFFGDSVLTAVYFQLTAFMVQLVESVILRLPPPPATFVQATADADSPVIVAPPSARAKAATRLAAKEARTFIVVNRSTLFCGQYTLLNQTPYHSRCVPSRDLLTVPFALLPGVNLLNDFVPPQNCSAGSMVSYRSSDLRYSCTPCPENTYSANAGSRVCLPCLPGQLANVGATVCEGKTPLPFWMWIIVALGALLCVALVALAVPVLLRRSQPLTVPAPLGPEVTLVIAGVECKRRSKWRRHILAVSDLTTELVARSASEARVYAVSAVGGVHLLAAETPERAFSFLEIMAAQAEHARWPVDVCLRFAVHTGHPEVIANADETPRVRYVGPDLTFVREAFKQCKRTGVWCTPSALSRLPSARRTDHNFVVAVSDGRVETIVEVTIPGGANMEPKCLGEFAAKEGVGDHLSESASSARGADLLDTEELAFSTLSIVTADEFVSAHEFANEFLRLFMAVLPTSVATSSVATACLRLGVRPPRVPSQSPKRHEGLKLLKQPIAALALQLLKQLEEMELVAVVDKWRAAAQTREPHHDETSATSSGDPLQNADSARRDIAIAE